MSSINSISGVNAISTTQASSNTRQDPMKKVMASVAELFGMSADELKAEQKNGKTLNDIAQEKGISTDDLQSTLAKALKENAPADAPAGADFVQMANDIAIGKGPGGPGGHGGHGGPPPPRPDSDGSNSASSSLSDLLEQFGISTDDLKTLLTSASSSSSTNTSSGTSTSDFATQLQALISKYGSKGNIYDTAL